MSCACLPTHRTSRQNSKSWIIEKLKSGSCDTLSIAKRRKKRTQEMWMNEWKSQLVTTKRGGKNERKIGTRWRWRDESEEKSREESRTLYLYRIFFCGFHSYRLFIDHDLSLKISQWKFRLCCKLRNNIPVKLFTICANGKCGENLKFLRTAEICQICDRLFTAGNALHRLEEFEISQQALCWQSMRNVQSAND